MPISSLSEEVDTSTAASNMTLVCRPWQSDAIRAASTMHNVEKIKAEGPSDLGGKEVCRHAFDVALPGEDQHRGPVRHDVLL